MMLISSKSNSKIKSVRALRRRKIRQESGLFVVEGIRHVGEAFEAKVEINSIYFAPELIKSEFAHELLAKIQASGIPSYAATAEVFTTMAEKENPQGILAVVCQPKHSLQDLNPINFPWGVALVSPQDPGNIGTILRTIDAVGASGLILLETSTDPYHPSAVRASMGTLFWYPILQAQFSEFREWAERHSFAIYGTSIRGDADSQEVDLHTRPCLLLMGSEREGLSSDQMQVCDKIVRLPMHGRSTSLNLAVAAGVILYRMLDN